MRAGSAVDVRTIFRVASALVIFIFTCGPASRDTTGTLHSIQRIERTLRVFAFLIISFGWFGRNAETVDFDGGKIGSAPQGWTLANTHRGDPGRWMVHPDSTAPSKPNVLAQLSADKNRAHFALALFDHGYCRDGDLSVNLKMISGKADQIAGLIWRYQDPNNYYALYLSAIEDKITVHKMVDGKATAIVQGSGSGQISAVSRRVDPQEWNLVKIQFRDAHTIVFFNHRKLFEVEDQTFVKPGKTGVWTKSDTVAYFDDFRIDKKK